MLRNRVGMAAMTRNRAPEAVPSPVMIEYYAQRAAGGAGLIVSEGILVSRQGFGQSLHLRRVNADISLQHRVALCTWYLEQGTSGGMEEGNGCRPQSRFSYLCSGLHLSPYLLCAILMVLPVMAWYVSARTTTSIKLTLSSVGRTAHPDTAEQKLAGTVSIFKSIPE
jgi:hypothetical protein